MRQSLRIERSKMGPIALILTKLRSFNPEALTRSNVMLFSGNGISSNVHFELNRVYLDLVIDIG